MMTLPGGCFLGEPMEAGIEALAKPVDWKVARNMLLCVESKTPD